MAIGTLLGTLSGNGNSIGATNSITGSVAVAVGDLVFVVMGQQTNLTATSASDNLGNTYTAQNVGTDAGAATGRMFWSRVTVAGTLTTVTVAASSSTNDWAGFAAVISGPLETSPADANPANISNDITSPFTCPASGTLTFSQEIVVAWMISDGNTAFTATSPNLLAGHNNNTNNINTTLGYQLVSSTGTVSPAFTGTNPTVSALGTMSFKGQLSAALSETLGALSSSATGAVKVQGSTTQTLATLTDSSTGAVKVSGTLSETLSAETLAATAQAIDSATLNQTLGDLTLVASGTVSGSVINGTLSQTLGAVSLSSTGTTVVEATVTQALDALTLIGTSAALDTAELSKNLAPATLATAGGPSIDGTLNQTLDSATLSAQGSAVVSANATNTLAPVILVASGDTTGAVNATLAATLSPATLAGAGTVVVNVAGAATLAPLSMSANANVTINATLSETLAAGTLAGSGSVDVSGTFSAVLQSLAAQANGQIVVDATLAEALQATTLIATGSTSPAVNGSLNETLAELSLFAQTQHYLVAEVGFVGVIPIQHATQVVSVENPTVSSPKHASVLVA